MIINATDLKNNLGKYLRLSAGEEIIITSNGKKVAKLSAYEERETAPSTSGLVQEKALICEATPRKASYEEFRELSENSDERYEYIDGEIYLLASPKVVHQRILGELYMIFYNWFQGKTCRPMFAPFDITLKRNADNINIVQPDLMVICDLDEKTNEKDYYMGVPALVAEIISESTRSKDLIKKLDLYMSTGVKEYWIVNPLSREVSIYLFKENNISQNATYKKDEHAVSYYFAGLEVSLAKLLAEPLQKS
jgi:prevent-host-death family protein